MDKVVYQEIVQETPFPGDPIILDNQSQTSSGGNLTQPLTNETPFPVKKSAVELLSTALNTRSKRILQEFQLQDSGALRIGNFEQGVSGDLRITPNGLVARDIAGLTTFAIDSLTGGATFKGVVQAAGFDIIDENGLVSLNSFSAGSLHKSPNTTFTSGSYIDMDAFLLPVVLKQTSWVLLFLTVVSTQDRPNSGLDGTGSVRYRIAQSFGGAGTVGYTPTIQIDAGYNVTTLVSENMKSRSSTTMLLARLGSGTNNFKVQGEILTNTNLNSTLNEYFLGYLALGS